VPPSASPRAIIGGVVWFFVAGLFAAYLAQQGYAAAAVGSSVAVPTVVIWYAVGWHGGRDEGRAAERWRNDHPPEPHRPEDRYSSGPTGY